MKYQIVMIGFLSSVLIVSPITVLHAAVKPDTNTPEKAPDNIYSEDKQNIMVNTKQPDFVLRLKSNPTTGYAWYLREYDNNLLTPLKHQFVKPEKENLIGAPGFELWTFKMKPTAFVVPQQTVIRMVYSRAQHGTDNSTQLVFRISTQARG